MPTGTERQVKTIRVQNHGPADASLRWNMLAPADPDRPLEAALGTTEEGGVALALGP